MRNSRASLFLMELMISILFFSLSSAVCIQLFVKAHTINETTEYKSSATLIAQDISEYFHNKCGDKLQLLSYFTEYEADGNNTVLYFTQNGNSCSATSAYYTATLTFGQDGSFNTLILQVSRTNSNEVLYSSILKKYVPATL